MVVLVSLTVNQLQIDSKIFTMSYSNQLKLSSLPKTPLGLWWEAWFLSSPHNRLQLYQMGEKPAHSFSSLASKACVFGMLESIPQLTLSPCWASGKVLVFKVCESLREGKKRQDLLQQLQLVMVWGCQVFPESLIYLLFSCHHSDKPTQSTLTTAFFLHPSLFTLQHYLIAAPFRHSNPTYSASLEIRNFTCISLNKNICIHFLEITIFFLENVMMVGMWCAVLLICCLAMSASHIGNSSRK